MMRTKFFLRFAAILMAVPLMLASCGGDDDNPLEDFLPGLIPGLGETEGELTGTPFTLPAGVELVEGITGVSWGVPSYWTRGDGDDYTRTFAKPGGQTPTPALSASQTRADDETVWHRRGSGMGFVTLSVKLRNTASAEATVVFPAALIVKSVTGECQHGVLIKKVTVNIPAGSDYNVALIMYCGNSSRDVAGSSDEYVWGVVSNAAPLLELCEMVKNKKINIEEFDPSSSADKDTYDGQLFMLQAAVWSVTDGSGLSEWERSWIVELPNS